MQPDFDFGRELSLARPALMRLARWFTRDHDRAEDLVQETCCRACVNQAQFQVGTNLDAWLTVIMRNLFITEYATAKRRKRSLETNFSISPFAQDRASENQQTRLEVMDLIASMSELSPDHCRVLVLSTLGQSYEQISDLEGIAIGTVKSRVHRAREILGNLH